MGAATARASTQAKAAIERVMVFLLIGDGRAAAASTLLYR
jgi:hypothetical protein